MKAVTYLAAFSLGIAAFASVATAAETSGWTSNLHEALATAKNENKAVLIEFTGSDWCPPCIAMRKNVFSKKEFIDVAKNDFVLVQLDFPKGDPALAEKNEPYAEKYEVEGFPTIVLLDSEGTPFSRFFAPQYPTVEEFLNQIRKQLERKDLD